MTLQVGMGRNNFMFYKIRFDSIGKIKTSLYSSPIEDDILEWDLNLDLNWRNK